MDGEAKPNNPTYSRGQSVTNLKMIYFLEDHIYFYTRINNIMKYKGKERY